MATVREIEEMLARGYFNSTRCLKALDIKVKLGGYDNETLEIKLASLFGNSQVRIQKYLSGIKKSEKFDTSCLDAVGVVVTFKGEVCPPLMSKLADHFHNNSKELWEYLIKTGDIDDIDDDNFYDTVGGKSDE